LIKIRVTKERREFCSDSLTLQPKESTESTNDLKNTGNKGSTLPPKEKKVLEIGLQAANQMKTFSA
jgi:DNA-directed RNA polymerase sigma subunit (sigma70/sigma32)